MQQALHVGIGPAVSRTEWKEPCLERQEADLQWDGSPIRRAKTWGVSLAVLPTPPLSTICGYRGRVGCEYAHQATNITK